jgi:hypothetical protein
LSEVVNLRMARKRKSREQAETTAAARRVEFGVARADKLLANARRDLAERGLDAHLIDVKPSNGK